jgi:hypothetical protein
MKAAGIFLTAAGALVFVSGARLAWIKYNMGESHDLPIFAGLAAVSAAAFVIGISLLLKSRNL